VEDEDQLRYSAHLPTRGCAGPPGHAEIVRVRDVLVITPDSVDQGDRDDLVLMPTWEGEPWEQHGWKHPEPISLGRGLALERLDQQLGEAILNACSARGHYFVPVRQFGQMYSLLWEVDTSELEAQRWNWDTEGVIQDATAISRLVLDNGYSTEYSARVFDHANGEQQIMPALSRRPAYRVRRARDWLTHAEAGVFKELLSEFWAVRDALPERVAHALWHVEYAASVRWLDVIAPLLVVAFEALINTSKQLVTRQFQERVPAVTEEVGVPLSQTLCEKMYDARSRWVHGGRVPLYRPPRGGADRWEGPSDAEQRAAVERIAKTQDSLRAVLRRCIEDAEFRAIFTSEESIKSRWPVAV
jgi:hypothetical protein